MESCKSCGAPVGYPEERREMELPVGSPVVCSRCGCVMRLNALLETESVEDSELEAYLEKWPSARQVRLDVISTEFTDGTSCPGCHNKIRNRHGVGTSQSPLPGSCSACGDCGAITIFTYDMRLRLAFPSERERILNSPSTPRKVVLTAQKWKGGKCPKN